MTGDCGGQSADSWGLIKAGMSWGLRQGCGEHCGRGDWWGMRPWEWDGLLIV
jgi:hypothetical protein